jgi:hypothetical protein
MFPSVAELSNFRAPPTRFEILVYLLAFFGRKTLSGDNSDSFRRAVLSPPTARASSFVRDSASRVKPLRPILNPKNLSEPREYRSKIEIFHRLTD